jgi:hypothetical protein
MITIIAKTVRRYKDFACSLTPPLSPTGFASYLVAGAFARALRYSSPPRFAEGEDFRYFPLKWLQLHNYRKLRDISFTDLVEWVGPSLLYGS